MSHPFSRLPGRVTGQQLDDIVDGALADAAAPLFDVVTEELGRSDSPTAQARPVLWRRVEATGLTWDDAVAQRNWITSNMRRKGWVLVDADRQGQTLFQYLHTLRVDIRRARTEA